VADSYRSPDDRAADTRPTRRGDEEAGKVGEPDETAGSHADATTLSTFDPSPVETTSLLQQAGGLVAELTASGGERTVLGHPGGEELASALVAAHPGAHPTEVEAALDTIRGILATGVDNAAPGELAYIPGSGLLAAALGDLIAAVANRHTGLASFTPAAVALEQGLLRWLTGLFGLPAGAQGLLLSGGSAANLTAIVAAREARSPTSSDRACIYVGRHAHASVRKAARIAGLRPEHVRVCGSSDGLRLDPEAVRVAVKQDRDDGLIPVAIVGAAGTTNAGAVDPLDDLATLSEELGLWLHVDAAYGGFFRLTERGRSRLAGIERADSITLDPHKSLFLPFGTGALLVRDRTTLEHTFAEEADYLRDHDDDPAPVASGPETLPDFSALSPELTRPWRGLGLWLALTLHGTDAFEVALDRALDLARWAYEQLAEDPDVEVGSRPDLSIVTFRVPGGDAAQDAALEAINAEGTVRLSSTVIGGRVTLRLAVLSHRTTEATVARAVTLIRDAARVGRDTSVRGRCAGEEPGAMR
jgi:aromatic-L-amino-acid decarboxylase